MPAAGAGRDTIEALLKEMYVPGIVRQTNDEVLLAKRLEANADNIVEGLKVVVAVDGSRTSGVGAARERGALPEAGAQNPQRATFNLKSLYGRGSVTGQSVRSTRSNAAAFARTLKFEADGLQRDLRDDFARQAYGGYDLAGAAAAGGIDASAAIAKVAVDNGSANFDLSNDQAIRMGWIYPGMVLDATDDFASIENAAALVVESVNVDGPDVTFTVDPTDVNAGDFLVRRGLIDSNGNVGITGVSAVLSDAEFGGLDPADPGLEYWKSEVVDVSGAFDSDDLHALWNRTRIGSGKESKSIITTYGIIRDYFKELQGQVQFVEPMKLEGGFRTLAFMDRPFIGDIDCPLGSLYLLDEKAVRFAADADFAPLDEDGHFLHWVTGYDMWEWALQRDIEMIADKRVSSSKMINITDLGY
jgi:hypothetical protein